jgi:hypothetical protein
MGWLGNLRHKRAEETQRAEAGRQDAEIPTREPEGVPGRQVSATWPAGSGRPDWMRDGMTVKLYEGAVDLEVVGESYHQDELRALVPNTRDRIRVPQHAILVPESGNPHDKDAVAVWVGGLLVGHLGRGDAAELRPGIISLVEQTGQAVAVDAVIVGGGLRSDGSEGLLGVWLRYAPEDFGLAGENSRPPDAPRRFRTGMSDAIQTDEADDSYDLSWLDGLPDDAAKRLPHLRKLTDTETDPMSRHYVLQALEADLYTLREVHPGMLEEYDEIAERHHTEMAKIRPALMAKFGDLPLLETYKQATIRNVKAGRLDTALRWANRGVEVYGQDAHDQSWVSDLHKRIAVIEAKIERQAQPTKVRPAGAPRTTATAPGPVLETLVCEDCGAEFERTRTRGRKPRFCPDCQAKHS